MFADCLNWVRHADPADKASAQDTADLFIYDTLSLATLIPNTGAGALRSSQWKAADSCSACGQATPAEVTKSNFV